MCIELGLGLYCVMIETKQSGKSFLYIPSFLPLVRYPQLETTQ